MEVREPSASYLATPAFKHTDVGRIPGDWNIYSLGSLTDPKRPISYGIVQTGPAVHDGVPCLRVVDIDNGRISTSNLITTTRAISDSYRRTVLQSGDLVVPLRGKVGDVALVENELAGGNLTRGVALIATHLDYSAPYIKHFIASDATRTRLAQSMNGSALQEISIAALRAFEVALPATRGEQQAIAEALSDADALIESLKQLLAKKRQIKQGAMQELLTGQRRLPGFAGVWETRAIGEFTDCTAGGTPSTRDPAYWGGSIRWMNSGELNLKTVLEVEGRITEDGLQNSSTKMIPTSCILIGLAGQGKTRGTVAMNLVPLCTNQSIAAIFPNETFDARYLYYNLDSRYEELRELSAGDGGRGGLNLTIIRSLTVPFPAIEEQTAIATTLSDMDAELSALEARLTKARQIKQGMAQALLTGRIRLV